MPNIAEYSNTQNLTPTDRGTEARATEARRIGAAYNQVAESVRDTGHRLGQQLGGAIQDAGNAAVQYATHREISQGVGSYALLQDSLITRWNDTAKNADPNDPSVRQKFIEGTLTPGLQKWADAFQTEGGQKWAQERQRALLDHMYEKTAADMGTLAGQAVMNNLRTYSNTAANTASRDPSSVDHLLTETDSSVGALVDSSPNLKGAVAGRAKTEAAEKTKEGIVKSGAMGAIKSSSDPEKTADEWTRKYPQYITPEEAHALAQNARTVIRARDADQRAAEHYKKDADAEASNEAVGEYITKVYNTNPKIAGDPLAQQMLDDKRLLKTDRAKLMQLRERELKPETEKAISEQTSIGLLRVLNAPGADAQKIMKKTWDARLTDAGKSGSLTASDFDRMRKEIEDRKTPEGLALQQDRAEFFKRFERTIDPDMNDFGMHSALGDQKRYLAERDARQMEAQFKAAGKSPQSLYDPSSPDYFGKQITKYRPTLADKAAFQAQEKADVARPTTFGDRFDAAAPAAAASGSHWWWPFGSSAPSAPAIPPPEKREVDHVYDTPKGKLKWTGTGWVPPKDESRAR